MSEGGQGGSSVPANSSKLPIVKDFTSLFYGYLFYGAYD